MKRAYKVLKEGGPLIQEGHVEKDQGTTKALFQSFTDWEIQKEEVL
jgi:hypothetical protein